MIFTDEDLHIVHAKPTQAVDILAFVEAQEIPVLYFETPYPLAPAPGDEKGYALLCETLRSTRKIGIAYVVIQARQHLAAVIPQGQSLVLNTLRWNCEAGCADSLVQDMAMVDAATMAGDMHSKKDGKIVVEDIAPLFDDEESDEEDDYLMSLLLPRPHPVDGSAVRRMRRPARWRQRPRVHFKARGA